MLQTLVYDGTRPVEVEEFHYGKLVVDHDGPVVSNAGYAITYRSAGVGDPKPLMPAALLGLSGLEFRHFDPLCDARGALFFAEVAERQSDVAVCRMRFRPENGENANGRRYLQARILLVKRSQWDADAPSIVRWAGRNFIATPDISRTPPARRYNVKPTVLSLDPLPRSDGAECAAADRQGRVARLLSYLCSEKKELHALGADLYRGEALEAIFLEDFARALSTVSLWPRHKLCSVPICIGLKAGVLAPGSQIPPSLSVSDLASDVALPPFARRISSMAVPAPVVLSHPQ